MKSSLLNEHSNNEMQRRMPIRSSEQATSYSSGIGCGKTEPMRASELHTTYLIVLKIPMRGQKVYEPFLQIAPSKKFEGSYRKNKVRDK